MNHTLEQIHQLARMRVKELEAELAEMKRIIGNDSGRGLKVERPMRKVEAPVTPKRRGRRNVTPEAKREQSERMRQRWAMIREAREKLAAAQSPAQETDFQPLPVDEHLHTEPDADQAPLQYGPEADEVAVLEPESPETPHKRKHGKR